MLGSFPLLITHPCDMSFLFLKGGGSSRSDSKQAQGAGMKLIQHFYNDVDIVAGLCWRCFRSLCCLNFNYIHMFWVYSCIYHFKGYLCFRKLAISKWISQAKKAFDYFLDWSNAHLVSMLIGDLLMKIVNVC